MRQWEKEGLKISFDLRQTHGERELIYETSSQAQSPLELHRSPANDKTSIIEVNHTFTNIQESVRAFYKSYFPVLSDFAPAVEDGTFDLPRGPGLGVQLRPEALDRDDLTRDISAGEGLAQGRRAMGDHWAVEEIR